mmetsp:Transcript_14437/g.22555  ORF Transcript_14437/g.22555 Transcript_14437/m.22555 type:complete len:1430 (-) Transcript_14437:136-4425(-)|eukprot:CAMPEP_0195296618 /NCGR_PEP_ID=MMETSP0707-20130614/19835_1 /TAXON_ID=33640 /ORGANISM="Asterionellopsis glacialis, Strain CCMP134" /LENGTH=1429 /DNA_ID=CAMNT_0040358181 /DNA_START=191 /DNA_END=4480 /DNA_ORIENTATION=+
MGFQIDVTLAEGKTPSQPPEALNNGETPASSPESSKVRDENDHGAWDVEQEWFQTGVNTMSRTAHSEDKSKSILNQTIIDKAETTTTTTPSKLIQTPQDPWTNPVDKSSVDVSNPPLGSVTNAGTRSSNHSDKHKIDTKMSGNMPTSSTMVVETRKPLTTHSNALPSQSRVDNYLVMHNANSDRGNRSNNNKTKNESIKSSSSHKAMPPAGDRPRDRSRTSGIDPTGLIFPSIGHSTKNVSATPPRPVPKTAAVSAPETVSPTSSARDIQLQPSRSSEEAPTVQQSRPPLDRQSTKGSRAKSPGPAPFPRNPKDTMSPSRRMRPTAGHPPRGDTVSVSSKKSSRSNPIIATDQAVNYQWGNRADPDAQEQALFEQRLCEDPFGVAVRKVNQNGKSTLRYVKCIPLDQEGEGSLPGDTRSRASSLSVTSLRRSLVSRRSARDPSLDRSESRANNGDVESIRNLANMNLNGKSRRALTWGKKRECKLPLDRFVCVRKGKTTSRTKRNPSPSGRLLSLITNDVSHASLDIEAPTRLDRDKFARAFARFLDVPLESGEGEMTVNGGTPKSAKQAISPANQRANNNNVNPIVLKAASESVGDHLNMEVDSNAPSAMQTPPVAQKAAPARPVQASSVQKEPKANENETPMPVLSSNIATASSKSPEEPHETEDEGSDVSSLTGAGFDQEIVEELHQALTELRAELEGSRAEAARAVKVAEQAIQSAERKSTGDWNSTVTHKAAEAAALAQKRSAEAIAKQRLAEERLAGERKTALYWRKQAEAAEEEAGVLQTRAASAEVQRACLVEELESERRNAKSIVNALKERYASADVHQKEALEDAMDRNRTLEIELDGTRRYLVSKEDEAKTLQDSLIELNADSKKGKKKRFGKKKGNQDSSNASTSLLSRDSTISPRINSPTNESTGLDSATADTVLKLQAEASSVRQQFEILRRATAAELMSLPKVTSEWGGLVAEALEASQTEIKRLHEKLALESSSRKKLLNEVQDMRGVVRVYCRPRAYSGPVSPRGKKSRSGGTISLSSQDTLLLHREHGGMKDMESDSDVKPFSFEFDRIFDTDLKQKEVYTEIEEVILGALDGYKVCVMAYGQTGSGKTHTMLGDVKYTKGDCNVKIENHGIHLQAARQLFTLAEHRNARYQDTFSLSIAEVHNERLFDMLAGTDIGEECGKIAVEDTKSAGTKKNGYRSRAGTEDDLSSFSHQGTSTGSRGGRQKLEIRTNQDGDTVVQGLLSIPIHDLQDVYQAWEESLSYRVARLEEQGMDYDEHESASHIIATLNVTSKNLATGVCNVGKIQFVDFAGADLISRLPPPANKNKSTSSDALMSSVGNNLEWKFANKSLATLNEVLNARCQFSHSVPYRNSTLTHLLRDSIEADTKVVMIVCASSDPRHLQETAVALRLASKMRQVHIGKATKHSHSNS